VNPLIKIINIVALLIVPIIATIHGGKPAPAAAAPPSAAPSEASPAVVPVVVVVGVPNRVHFDSGSDAISAAGKRIVGGYAQALKQNPEAKVELSGFADPSGDAAKNLELAKMRAMTVRDALVGHGVTAERISLVKPTDVILVGQERDADARRVDIVLR
jgi:K(+)-stimulated pyrophosphate-energized sodium pump